MPKLFWIDCLHTNSLAFCRGHYTIIASGFTRITHITHDGIKNNDKRLLQYEVVTYGKKQHVVSKYDYLSSADLIAPALGRTTASLGLDLSLATPRKAGKRG